MSRLQNNRNFLKSNFAEFRSIKTDAMQGMPQPPKLKPYEMNSKIIDLPAVNENILINNNIHTCIKERRSTRLYGEKPLTLDEFSYLLWATQGLNGVSKAGLMLRTVPCSGATHS